MNYLDLPLGDLVPEVLNAIVEIPLGNVNKYEYDKKLHVFRLDRTLFSPVHYPGDYGFFPQTLAADGDPLDMLVLVETPSFPGCLMEVRPIGVLEMLDQGIKDEKILTVALHNPRYSEVHNYRRSILTSCGKSRIFSGFTRTSKANAHRCWGGRMQRRRAPSFLKVIGDF